PLGGTLFPYSTLFRSFAESLSQFDEVILLDIYPARELPIEGITSGLLLEKINNPNKKIVSKQELEKEVLTSNAQIIAMVGAGDIGEMVVPLAEDLQIHKFTNSQSSKETKSRSEEHTSELQSRENLVCRLLL